MGNQASNEHQPHAPRAMNFFQRPESSAKPGEQPNTDEHQQEDASLPTVFGKHPLTGRGFYPIPRSQLATHDVDQDSAPQPRQSSPEKAFTEEQGKTDIRYHHEDANKEKQQLPQGLSPLQGLRSMFSNVSPKLAPRRASNPTINVTPDVMKERGNVMVIEHIQGGINADNAETGYDEMPRVEMDYSIEERDPTRIVLGD